MRNKFLFVSILILSLFGLAGQPALAADTGAPAAPAVVQPANLRTANVQVPFIANRGQLADPSIKFYANTFAGTVFVSPEGLTYALPGQDGQGVVLREEFAGGQTPDIRGAVLSPAKVSVFHGNDSSAWQSGLPSYDEISLGEVYDRVRVDLRAYGNNVEKIFTVEPGGDPAIIALKVTGASSLNLDEQGQLNMVTALGGFALTRPVAYQLIGGVRTDVTAAYALKADGYGFTLGAYDPAYPLVIDPLLASTFLGGSATESGYALAVDGAGNVYAAGTTTSTDFPYSEQAYSKLLNNTATNGTSPPTDLYVAKLSGDLSRVIAATYIGGSYADGVSNGHTLALDNAGNVYLAGYTKSPDFPTQNGYDSSFNDTSSTNDIVVVKLTGDLSGLLGATFLGGAKNDTLSGLTLDNSGNVYVAGNTASTDFPAAGGFQQAYGGGASIDGFVAKFSGNLSALLGATYLGGDRNDQLNCIAVDAAGRVYVGGQTLKGTSNPFPTTVGACRTLIGDSVNSDGFVSILSGDLTQLLASTYVGTDNNAEQVYGFAVDPAGSYLYAALMGTGFSVTPGAYQQDPAHTGSNEIGIFKLNGSLTEVLISATLGGTKGDSAKYIALEPSGSILFAGTSGSADYPTTDGAFSRTIKPTSGDIVLTRMTGDLSTLLASTYFGGTGSDTLGDMALDSSGNIYLTGVPNASGYADFPITAGGLQTTQKGSSDAFVSKLSADLSLADTVTPSWPEGSELTPSQAGPDNLTLSWNVASDNVGVSGYRVYQGETLLTTLDGGTLSYTVSGLSPGTAYTFSVQAGDAAENWSADGPTVTATTATGGDGDAPYWNSPVLNTAGVTQSGLTLSWAPAGDNTGVSAYKVYQDDTLLGTVSGSTLTYTVSGLAAGTFYTFRVQAGDAAGNWSTDGPSAGVTTAEADQSPPAWDNPVLTTANIGKYSLTLNWEAAQDNVGVSAYRIYRDDALLTTVGGSTLTYNAGSLAAGTAYTFRVRAGDDAGNWSTDGPSVTVATLPEIDTVAPVFTSTSLSYPIVTSSSSLILSWPKAIDNVGVTAYRITYGGNVQVVDGSLLSYEITGLDNAIAYDFFVQAGDAAGNWSSSLSVNAQIGTSGFYLTGAYLSVIDPVTHISSTGASVINSGSVPYNPAPTIKMMFTKNVVTDGIWPNNQQCFALHDAAGGSISATVSRIPDTVNFDERNNLFITPDSPLQPGTAYKITISQNLAAKNGDYLGYVREFGFTTATADSQAPAWPSGSSLTAGSITQSSLTLTWTAATDDVGVTQYQVFQNGNLIYATGDGNTLTHTVTGLAPSTEYTFQVWALDGGGNTAAGPNAAATTAAPTQAGTPAWPAGSTATVTYTAAAHDRVTLSWPAASDDNGVTGYKIYENGSELATLDGSALTWTATGLTEAASYTFKIEAGNAAGNWSTNGPTANAYTGGGAWYGGGNSTAPFEFLNAFLTTATPESSLSDTGDNVAGNQNVPVDATIKLNFSKNAIDDSLWTSNQQLISLLDGSGATVAANVFRINNSNEKNNIFITPAAPLSPGSQYKILMQAGIGSKSGTSTPNIVEVVFNTAGTGGTDNSAPVWADGSGLNASNRTNSSLTLSWPEATDNVGVIAYRIYQDDALLDTVGSDTLTYSVTGLAAGRWYSFKVEAGDEAGNWSDNGPAFSYDTLLTPPAGKYTVTADSDPNFSNGRTADGITYLTVMDGVSGMKYFSVHVTPLTPHDGDETVIFVLLRQGAQISINAARADFDIVDNAQAGFNVQSGDIVKVYLVDDLTNTVDRNPIILI